MIHCCTCISGNRVSLMLIFLHIFNLEEDRSLKTGWNISTLQKQQGGKGQRLPPCHCFVLHFLPWRSMSHPIHPEHGLRMSQTMATPDRKPKGTTAMQKYHGKLQYISDTSGMHWTNRVPLRFDSTYILNQLYNIAGPIKLQAKVPWKKCPCHLYQIISILPNWTKPINKEDVFQPSGPNVAFEKQKFFNGKE